MSKMHNEEQTTGDTVCVQDDDLMTNESIGMDRFR